MRASQTIVHARLDPETRRILERLRRRTGQRDSTLIRRALRALDAAELRLGARRIVGLGAFASGVDDLGSNDEHLRGFGS
jgi:hypothetical protein